MKIKKILNIDAIIAISNDNKEFILIDKNIGLVTSTDALLEISTSTVQISFEHKSDLDKLSSLISETKPEFVSLTLEIINLAEHKLEKKLNNSVYLSLIDHISFAIKRYTNGINLTNPILNEIKTFHKEEFLIGIEAIKLIQERLSLDFTEDEAASIALHIVNAQLDEDLPNVINITTMMQDILTIIKYALKINFNEDDLSFHRLVTHLKFLSQRMLNNSQAKNGDEYLYLSVKTKYPDSYKCAEKVRSFLSISYDFALSMEEMTYLIIHIERLISREDL